MKSVAIVVTVITLVLLGASPFILWWGIRQHRRTMAQFDETIEKMETFYEQITGKLWPGDTKEG